MIVFEPGCICCAFENHECLLLILHGHHAQRSPHDLLKKPRTNTTYSLEIPLEHKAIKKKKKKNIGRSLQQPPTDPETKSPQEEPVLLHLVPPK